VLRSERGELVTSQFVVAEADHLILRRLGVDAELRFRGSFTVLPADAE
jgi:hypothetical protein